MHILMGSEDGNFEDDAGAGRLCGSLSSSSSQEASQVESFAIHRNNIISTLLLFDFFPSLENKLVLIP